MAKSNIDDRNSKRVKVDTVQLRDTVRLVLLHPMILKAIGSITGAEYTWSGAGSIVEVDAEDAKELITKGWNACEKCSGLGFTPYFEIVR